MTTISELVASALAALAALGTVAEGVEDEWQYVTDLRLVWQARLEHVAVARGSEPVAPAVGEAVARAIDELRAIKEPHRAIDWLSTFPQLVLLAIDEPG